MKLTVECSWNEGKNKAKQTIYFTNQPKSLFSIPNEVIPKVQAMSQRAVHEGPPVLKELEELEKKYSKSQYIKIMHLQTLAFFEYEEEAIALLERLKKEFSDQPFVQCAIASKLLQEKKFEPFLAVFNNMEVFKGCFPKRRGFFFEEALFFHNLWAGYYQKIGNQKKSEKHQQFIALIMNTFESFMQQNALLTSSKQSQ